MNLKAVKKNSILSAQQFDHLVAYTGAYDVSVVTVIEKLTEMRAVVCASIGSVSTAIEMDGIDECTSAYDKLIQALKNKEVSAQDLATLKTLLQN